MDVGAMKTGKGDLRTIASGLFPAGDELPSTKEGRDEVRAAVDALLRVWDHSSAKLLLALEQLDRAADEIERLRAQLTEAAAFLDVLADKLETCVGIITNDPECPCQEHAADCRAMAEKLRK